MYCPRCGTQNEEGNRFCVSCGSELAAAGPKTESRSFKQRLGDLLGRSRRARLLTVATVAAVAIAVIAFIALDPGDESGGGDSYLVGLDAGCAAEKERISALETEALAQGAPGASAFASVLVAAVAEWRGALREVQPAATEAAAVGQLEAALLDVLIESGALARVVREGGSGEEIAAQAGEVDAATAELNRTIEGLGLERCAALKVSPVS